MDKPEQKVTKTFDYDKRKDRFSDHIPSSKKYSNQNASSVNGTKIMIEVQGKQQPNLLKSAASSPTLGKNGTIEQKQVCKRKKSPRQSSASLTKHKRSASDGTSLQKMFHFKQQLLIQKFHKQQESSDSQNSHEQVVLS